MQNRIRIHGTTRSNASSVFTASPRFILISLFIVSQLLSSFCFASQSVPKTRRNLHEEIANCPFLQMIPAGDWKEVKGDTANLIDRFVDLGERKDYEIASAVFNSLEYVFGLQVARVDLPRWVLLLKDPSTKKPIFRYSGLIKVRGYDVDQVAFSAKGCKKLTSIVTLVAEESYRMLAYEIVNKHLDEVMVMDACDDEYRTVSCGSTGVRQAGPFGEISMELNVLLDDRMPFGVVLSKGDCAQYEGRVIDALTILYAEKIKD